MKIKEFLEGYRGERGVPDGSGPGPGRVGRGMGNCPKREDFDSEKEYKKALKKFREEALKERSGLRRN